MHSVGVLPEEAREQERGPLASPGSGAPVPAPLFARGGGQSPQLQRAQKAD